MEKSMMRETLPEEFIPVARALASPLPPDVPDWDSVIVPFIDSESSQNKIAACFSNSKAHEKTDLATFTDAVICTQSTKCWEKEATLK
jgi:hypothetical protein